MSERTVSPNKAAALIKICMDSNRPCFLAGPPGIGKSDLMEQIGQSYRKVDDKGNEITPARPVIDMRLLLMEPTDIKGIPYYNPDEKTMIWAPSNELPTEENGMENAILFLDEMNAAPPAVQAAAYQLILNRRVGEYVLPDGVSIVAAGNRESDRGVVYRMPSPLANRFVHFDMEANYEDWQEWALNNGVHQDVVGFLKKHSHKLFTFDPKSPDKAFATPRTWAFVSELLNTAEKDPSFSEENINIIVSGTVGDGLATEFATHRRYVEQLPDPLDVLSGKVTKLGSECKEVSAHYSLVVSLCYRLKNLYPLIDMSEEERPEKFKDMDNKKWHKYFDNYLKFMLDNMQPEMIVLGATTAFRKNMFALDVDQDLLDSFTTLYKKYGDMIIGR